MSAFFGSAFTSAKSLALPQYLLSACILVQLSPASSLLKIPPSLPASTVSYILFESEGAIQKPILPKPCSVVGKPLVIFFHVVPPSVDLNNPLSVPFHAPFSHGPCLPAHMSAKTMFELFGSIVTWTAPVFSSLYKTLSHVLPPSIVL